MLIQKNDLLCSLVLHKNEERVKYIAEHPDEFYTEFHRFKTDKLGNKKLNRPKYARFGIYWTRTINPPKSELKNIQKQINKYLVNNIEISGYAFGGIKRRDNIQNARFHKGQKYVFQTDLKDFFPYITNKLVYEMYVRVGFSYDVSSLLTKLTTYKGHLPQGAPTSTTIANLVFMPTGMKLQAIAAKGKLRFTTFVDDVTLSSQTDFKDVIPEIIETIVSSGFKISHGKTTYKSGIKEITGVKMLNNKMATTDKFNAAFSREVDKTTPRAKGLLNYLKRIELFSKSKKYKI